jgi:cytochrome P450 family 628
VISIIFPGEKAFRAPKLLLGLLQVLFDIVLFSTLADSKMFLLNGTEFQLALALGPISHLCIFIHGELNNYAAHIAAFFFLVYLSTVVIFYLSEPCIIANIVKASILISTYLLALGGSILIYRALFHRLRQFPGDIFDSLSKWGAVMKAQRNAQYFLELRDLHKKYGDYVRIGQFQRLSQNSLRLLNHRPGPSELSINNASVVQALHSSQCTKGPWYDLGGTNVNIHRTRDRKIHDRQRVFWDKAASGNGTFSSYCNSHYF